MKQFLIVGNISAITYANVFPYLKSRVVKYRPECYGIKCYDNTNVKAMATWYTTMETPYIPPLQLTKSYNPEDYPKYDNYDAIYVDRTINIPYDYDGVMGVPTTFLDKWNPGQFEVIGILNDYKEADESRGLLRGEKIMILEGGTKPRLFAGTVVNGKQKYIRIMIKRR
jgi:hypothetical protein